ncbi:PIG-X [Panaeolus papilionaceus]|nr:PIG-X [Panaeolus papilionaceus]
MASFNTSLNPNKGFHPTSVTTINNPGNHYQQCSLHLYFNLPALVFVDTNELSQRSTDYTYKHWGNTDLEKPVHALPDARTELLITLASVSAVQSTNEVPKAIEVLVPLHFRYGLPRKHKSNAHDEAYEQINIHWPTPFFRCLDSTMQGYSDSVNLPQHVFDALDNSTRTQGHSLIPILPHSTTGNAYDTVNLPLGFKNDLVFVEPLTAITIVLCAFWILRVALKTASRLTSQGSKKTTSNKKSE